MIRFLLTIAVIALDLYNIQLPGLIPATINPPLSKLEEPVDTEKYNYQATPFREVAQYPTIKDSAAFINALAANCHQYHKKSSAEINYFKKLKLLGSNQFYYLIEYDFKDGSTGSYPWKNQYLFTSSGKLVTLFSAERIDIAKIFPEKNPLLICVNVTGKGNGYHEVYCMEKDTVRQIFDYAPGTPPQTYDAHGDVSENIPFEFPYTITDVNKDGYNDLVFKGTINYSFEGPEENSKKAPARLVFLYKPSTGLFSPQEDYRKKYAFIFGQESL